MLGQRVELLLFLYLCTQFVTRIMELLPRELLLISGCIQLNSSLKKRCHLSTEVAQSATPQSVTWWHHKTFKYLTTEVMRSLKCIQRPHLSQTTNQNSPLFSMTTTIIEMVYKEFDTKLLCTLLRLKGINTQKMHSVLCGHSLHSLMTSVKQKLQRQNWLSLLHFSSSIVGAFWL